MGDSWKKFKGMVSDNLRGNVKKIAAAFGAFLILVIMALSVPLGNIFVDSFTPEWAEFAKSVWYGLTVFLIVFIVSLFGKEEYNDKKEK